MSNSPAELYNTAYSSSRSTSFWQDLVTKDNNQTQKSMVDVTPLAQQLPFNQEKIKNILELAKQNSAPKGDLPQDDIKAIAAQNAKTTIEKKTLGKYTALALESKSKDIARTF